MRVYVLRCVHGLEAKARPECDVWVYLTLSGAVEEMLLKVPSDVAEEIRLVRGEGDRPFIQPGDNEMVLDAWFDDGDARWCLTAEEVEE